jgi:glutathione synthase/RimK-type ligase-like ATP-grasp enzyme
MTKLINFDVLIVYTETLATSASDKSASHNTPFSRRSRNASYNLVYGYFLETCALYNLKAAFTTSADIIGPGFCKSFWLFKDNTWFKVNSACYSRLIFDKFSPITKNIKSRRQLLFSDANVKPFNDPDLFNIFFDKQLTYEKLSDYSIPTISLEDNSLQSIDHACQTLAAFMSGHPGSKDFTSDLVMKDRFGAGGRHVYKFKSGQSENMLAVIRKNTHVSFIIQPFAEFDRGFSYHNCPVSTDIRLIYLNGQIINSYVRMAKSGDFRCNQHQGGLLSYLSLNEIPPSLIAKSNLIAKLLNKTGSFYTLDFIITNSGNSYLLEGNTGPGLNWEKSCPKDESESKRLIGLVVSELALRSKTQSNCLN